MNIKKYIKAFIVGSSFPVIMTPYLYIGVPLHFKPEADVTYLYDVLLVPILIGSLNMLCVALRRRATWSTNTHYWVCGAVNGLFFSLMGTLLTSIPTDLFGLTDTTKFTMIPVAMILYALIWRYIVRNINILMEIEHA